MRPPASAGYATRAAELDRARPVRTRARSAVRGAALAVLGRRTRRFAPGVRIVHYHSVFDDELESFARQLAFLVDTFEPVSLTEAVKRLRMGAGEGRELAVTFDDGFRNQFRNAAPRLAEHGVSACFFLITGLVSATPHLAAQMCLDRLHLPRPVEPLSWEEVEELLELGHEIGSHTRTHPNLVELEPPAMEEELRSSKEELEQRLGRPIAHVSAPYGDRARFSPEVSRAARTAGYASCSTALRGVNGAGQDLFSLRRNHLDASWPVAHLRYFLGHG